MVVRVGVGRKTFIRWGARGDGEKLKMYRDRSFSGGRGSGMAIIEGSRDLTPQAQMAEASTETI